jgi:hypothetical protein
MVLFAHRFHAEAMVCLGQAERLDLREIRWPYYRDKCWSGEPGHGHRKTATGGRGWQPCPRCASALAGGPLAVRGRHDEAADQYRVVLAAEPGNARAHLGLGRLAYERNDLPEALAQLDASCLADLRTRKAAGTLIAGIHRHQGESAAADQELKRVAALPPDAPCRTAPTRSTNCKPAAKPTATAPVNCTTGVREGSDQPAPADGPTTPLGRRLAHARAGPSGTG